jgi:hypothetical protein
MSSKPRFQEPFSPEELKYIAELDGEADAKKLGKRFWFRKFSVTKAYS